MGDKNWDYSENKSRVLYKKTQKTILKYQFWKSGDGWIVYYEEYHVDSPSPEVNKMWLPDDMIDIFLSEKAKGDLADES